MKGDYAQAVEKALAGTPGARGVARAALSVLSTRCYGLLGYVPARGSRLLEAYLAWFLFEDLKRVLRAKSAGVEVDSGALVPVPLEQDGVDLRTVIDAPTLDDAVAHLQKKGIGGLASHIGDGGGPGGISTAEAAIDRAFFGRLLSLLPGVPDEGEVKDALVAEADLAGVVAMADLKCRDLPGEAIRSAAFEPVSLSRYQTSSLLESSVDSFSEAVSKTRFSRLAQAFADSLAPGGEGNLDHLMKAELQRQARTATVKAANSFAYVFGYIRRARAEADNIVSLATGKELGLEEDEISRALCL